MLTPYHRIYLDTNVFISLHWPSISTSFRNAAEFAATFEVPIILLEQVEHELRNHWLTETSEATQALIRQSKSLTARLREAGTEWSLKPPNGKNIDRAFHAKHAETVRELKLTRAAPVLRSTAELFDMAVAKKRPFEAKGKNFQDPVILLAAIDDMIASSTREGAFVSNDAVFDESVLQDLCASSKIGLHLFKSIDALWSDMARYFDKTMQEMYDFNEAVAKKEVTENQQKIRAFLEENLEIPMTVGGFLRRHLTRVNRIEIAGIRKIVFPISPDETVEENRMAEADSKLSAYLDVKIYATARVLRASEQETTTLKVGKSRPPVTTRSGSIYVDQEEILNRIVVVELERHVDPTGEVQLTPTLVSFTTEMNAGRQGTSLAVIPRIGSEIKGL